MWSSGSIQSSGLIEGNGLEAVGWGGWLSESYGWLLLYSTGLRQRRKCVACEK